MENKFLFFILFLHVCVCLCECDIKWFSIEKKKSSKNYWNHIAYFGTKLFNSDLYPAFYGQNKSKIFWCKCWIVDLKDKRKISYDFNPFFTWIFECNEFFKLLFFQLVLNTRFKMIKMSGYFVINNFLSILIHCEVTHLYGSDNRVYN